MTKCTFTLFPAHKMQRVMQNVKIINSLNQVYSVKDYKHYLELPEM